MADTLEILDLPESGQIQLSIVDETGRRESAPPVSFLFPLTDAELLELAWFLHRLRFRAIRGIARPGRGRRGGTARLGAADAGIGLPGQ